MRFSSGRRAFRVALVAGLALTFSASAFAYICHPHLLGTRSLTVQGRVDGYTLRGARVAIDAWINGCERQIVWRPLASKSSQTGCTGTAPAPGAADSRRTASDGRVRVVLSQGGSVPDRPDRLAVYDARTGAELHDWPLPVRASSVDVARGVALLSSSNGVYAVRLSDGRFALVGVKRRGDYPQIEPSGIAFQDDLYKRARSGRSVLKFVPFAGVRHALRPFRPLRVPAAIGDFSLDGRTVIFVKKDPAGRCDHIGLWTIPWHYASDLMAEPPVCPEEHAPGHITAVALGGQYLEIVTTYGRTQTLISSTMVKCVEKVVTRTRLGAAAIRPLSADGAMSAYAIGAKDRPARVGVLEGQEPTVATSTPSAVIQLSVDRGQLAVLRADGQIDVRDGERLVRSFGPMNARALALRAGQLVVLTRGRTLDVYSVADGRLLHSWVVPRGARPAVDVHFGVAVLTAGRKVFATQLAGGRTRVLLRAPSPVRAHLDDVGVVYTYNTGRGGVLGFMPFAAVERTLSRAG
jgi:hypothetical protein